MRFKCAEEMLKRQLDYDLAVFDEFQMRPSLDQIKLALFDELGETVHAAKIFWCWWKKALQHEDKQEAEKAMEAARQDILFELADSMHFILCIALTDHNPEQNLKQLAMDISDLIPECGFNTSYCDMLDESMKSIEQIVYAMSMISEADYICKGELFMASLAHMYKDIFVLASAFGIDEKTLVDAYKAKNDINMRRLAENY